MHPINKLLPEIERENIQKNDENNLQNILNTFEKVKNDKNIVNSKLFGKALRLLDSRLTMKYNHTVENLSTFTQIIIDIYLNKRVSIPMKIKSLALVTRILKYRKFSLQINVPWSPFWNEIASICTRSSKEHSIACEGLNMKLFESLINFVHEVRHHFTEEASLQIYNEGMNLLKDLRNPLSFFGLEMLILLLPTHSSLLNYDEMIPKWVELFTKITDNETWDCCILTLLCRARKFSKTFNWLSILPTLLVKTKELLQLPVSKGKPPKTTTYPFTFPAYINVLKVSPMDYRKTALKKMSKLLYFLCYSGDITLTPPCTITPPIQARELFVVGMNQSENIFSGAKELIQFLQVNRTYFYPSNTGTWTSDVGYLLLCLTNEMGQHLGQGILHSTAFDSLYTNLENIQQTDLLEWQIKSLKKNLHQTSTSYSNLNVSSSSSSSSELLNIQNSFPKIHLPTIKYLSGALTSITLEGLYGKSPFMIQSCNFCLRNLCSIEPSLGNVIVPFLISALHPDAVTQSHMAPAAMTAINYTIKPLLYPQPIILPYMNDLLNLSLAGIDPNDPQKTVTTLAMYNSIFSWLPSHVIGNDDIRINGKQSIDNTLPPHYLQIIEGNFTPASTSESYSILFNENILNVLNTWYPKFIEKLFILLNSKEKKQDGKNSHQTTSTLTSFIEESFFEVISCLNSKLRLHVLNLVLDYSNSTNAFNAIKEIGKMLESLISLQPTLLPIALDKLIDLDLISGDCSHEKIALKIRLVGACLRRASGNNIIPIINKIQFLFSDEFKHHTEKHVRKAVCKLVKDTLKGLSSFYIQPSYNNNNNNNNDNSDNITYHILGRPNHADTVELSWHIPSKESVEASIHILKSQATNSMDAIETILNNTNENLELKDDQNQSLKKIEEQIITYLNLIRRSLRGAAEILGDKSHSLSEHHLEKDNNNNNNKEELEGEGELEEVDEQENDIQNILIETGRSNILNLLSEDDKLYLETLRYKVVSFLNRIYSKLLENSNHPTNSILSSLYNNPSIHSVWMKIFGVTVMIRMAVLKNIDQMKKWFSLSKRMIKSSTVIYLEKTMKKLQFSGLKSLLTSSTSSTTVEAEVTTTNNNINNKELSWITEIQTPEYWIGHDLTARTVTDRSWIQHILREKELSFLSIYSEQRLYKNKSEYVKALQNITITCNHEYDAIRSKAIKIFKEVSSRFGSSLESLLRPLLKSISNIGTTYSVSSGSLSILSLDLVQKRITGSSSLTSLFLRSLRLFPTMVNSIDEPDKREKLADKLSSLFGKFLSSWHHIPMNTWTSSDKAPMTKLLIQILSDFGIKNQYDNDDNNNVNHNNNNIENNNSSSNNELSTTKDENLISGLRHQLYLASSILIFIGHDDIELPFGIWDWAISNLLSAHGQPIQLLSLSTLTKLSLIENRKFGDNNQNNNSKQVSYIQSRLSTLFNSIQNSQSFLTGLSQCRLHTPNQSNSNNAQWSKGVDVILRNSEYISGVLSRYEFVYTDITTFSNIFKLSHASTITNLLSLSIGINTNIDETNIESIQLFINNLLQASKDINSTNEEEIRSVNTTKAEVFSGITRFLLLKERSGTLIKYTENLWKDLLNYLNENISKISLDYSTDWAEAIAFGFGASPNLSSNIICDYLIQSTQKLFSTQEVINENDNNSNNEINTNNNIQNNISDSNLSTGFTKDAKVLHLTRALLQTDIVASSYPSLESLRPKNIPYHQTTGLSSIGKSLLNSIIQSNSCIQPSTNSIFISPYLAIRLELSKIFSKLVDIDLQKTDLDSLIQTILTHSKLTSLTSTKMEIVESQDNNDNIDNNNNNIENQQDVNWKLSCDLACRLIERLIHTSFLHKYEEIICPLLSIVIEGCGYYEIELSKLCHHICLSFSHYIKLYPSIQREENTNDFFFSILKTFSDQINSTSLHIRETVIISLSILFVNNYPIMTNNEKKLCKDIFSNGFHDPKPEVQVLSIVGMITYLSIKSIDELNNLATSYVKNSDILATREKKKRKQNKDTNLISSNEKPDPIYLTTIKMSSCMILLYPYDLPQYLPILLTSFVRHSSNQFMKDTIMKTVQDFKRTHQDRWNEFQVYFTREQLDDLQGAGAAHYFS